MFIPCIINCINFIWLIANESVARLLSELKSSILKELKEFDSYILQPGSKFSHSHSHLIIG